MISSRIVSLTVYAVIYHEFVLVAIFLHWISMILWLFSPKNLFFYGEQISKSKRFLYSLLLGWIYIFCYINLHEVRFPSFYVLYVLCNASFFTIFFEHHEKDYHFKKQTGNTNAVRERKKRKESFDIWREFYSFSFHLPLPSSSSSSLL